MCGRQLFINSDSSDQACPQRMVRVVFATPICVVATLKDKDAGAVFTGQSLEQHERLAKKAYWCHCDMKVAEACVGTDWMTKSSEITAESGAQVAAERKVERELAERRARRREEE
jgi:hypothetical protein